MTNSSTFIKCDLQDLRNESKSKEYRILDVKKLGSKVVPAKIGERS